MVLFQDLGFINSRGKRVEQHHDITEDQKPKQLDLPMAGQVQLYEAIAHLPECHTFPNWTTLETFYNAQKQHVQGVPQESGNAIFGFKFSVPADPTESKNPSDLPVPQTTNVILPAVLKRQFPMSVDTPLALLPCPHCLHNITVSMNHIGKLDNPMDQFLDGPEEEEEVDKKPAIEAGKPTGEETSNAPILDEIVRQMMVCVCTMYSGISEVALKVRCPD